MDSIRSLRDQASNIASGPQIVELSHLKFAGFQPIPDAFDQKDTATIKPLPVLVPHERPTSSADRLNSHGLQAGGNPDEELAPEAGIWQLYLDEAKEYDNELVESENKNLDLLLLFAGLFSAVLTAFLIESKNLLQQDTAGASVELLLMIAQSQQRVEQGEALQGLPPVQIPAFSVAKSARWINGLWFTALAMSLSAALVALLAKEWLTEFTSSRPRPAHKYSVLRQSRLEGLNHWGALHIINLLPSLLHLALLLFSLGLVVYLWTLDKGIACVIMIITGSTLLFYLAISILGAVHEFCPFVTQISKYIHSLVKICASVWRPSQMDSIATDPPLNVYTTDRDLRALKWLADNARDPAIGDCAYQALSGLHISSFEHSTRPETIGESRERYNLLNSLFYTACRRLSSALPFQPGELAACGGLNAARYAAALPKMIQFLENHTVSPVPKSEQELNISPVCFAFGKLVQSAQLSLGALDSIWDNECPPFTPDSYAILTAAELQLAVSIANLHQSPSSATTPEKSHIESSIRLPNLRSTSNAFSVTESWVDITDEVYPKINVPLFELRARYSRALCRAAFQLICHGEGSAPIHSGPLMYLLNSISLAGRCKSLTSDSQMFLSTHHPQSEENIAPEFWVHVVGAPAERILRPSDIGDADGILVGILRVLGSADIDSAPGVELAASNSLAIIFPVLLSQWLRMNPEVPSDTPTPLMEALLQWSTNPVADKANGLVDRTIKLLLITATIAVSYAGCAGIMDLPEYAMFALCYRAKLPSGRIPTHRVLTDEYMFLSHLIRLMRQKYELLNQRTRRSFVRLLAIKYTTSMFSWVVELEDLPSVLYIMGKTPECAPELQVLLADLIQCLTDWKQFIGGFTRSTQGFSQLAGVAEHSAYIPIVARCIASVVSTIAYDTSDWNPEHGMILAPAVPGFLDAVALTLRNTHSGEGDPIDSVAFMQACLALLHKTQDDGMLAVANHDSTKSICEALQSQAIPSDAGSELLLELVEIQQFTEAEDIPLRWMPLIFEH
ncbi:hypothetical protein BDV93DRAFT_547819 [Ceratobasidium sp. AG-I]|nr:hypothetical protein BDV93DRAFT_547819 [Ceratobasidium sp. AG-I]